ncbi:GNAT family N-acetyltransferase [Aliidiomarina iranensis]|nr:GNAT family N-acetyltransferase [Aliidiomarina iranensis]
MMATTQTNQQYRKVLFIGADTKLPKVEFALLKLDATNVNQYRQYLGTEHRCIFFDLSEQFHADALLAVSGTLAGGGLLILRLPQKLTPSSQRLLFTLANAGLDTHLTDSSELQRLLTLHAKRNFQGANLAGKPKVASETKSLQSQAYKSTALEPTCEQAKALTQLSNIDSGAVLLNAARGRGKSSLLGFWIAAAKERFRFTLCAPSKRQAQSVFFSASNSAGITSFKFLAPDQLPSYQQTDNEWLLIDEAASLPSHVLQSLAERCQRLAIATTTEGYESAGRGFLLRFQQALPNYFQQVFTLNLHEPIRWADGDPLEAGLNRCFCVYPNEPTAQISGQANYQQVHAASLSPEVLEQAFILLTNAHYQTSPNDLRLLLDDRKQQLILQWHRNTLTGVCWIADEGPITEELIQPIFEGKRRPAGQLLPQSMCFHLRSKAAAQLSMQRIVRIAIAPQVQQQGAGSALLDFVLIQAKGNYNLIGTSFGVSERLHRFWLRNEFLPLRVGQHIDAASGMYSGLYARTPEPGQYSPLLQELFQRFCTYFPFQQLTTTSTQQLRWLQDWSLTQAEEYFDKTALLSSYLSDFAAGFIPFELLQPVLAEAAHRGVLPSGLLASCASAGNTLTELAESHGFHGKKALTQHLRYLASLLVESKQKQLL